MAVSVKARAAMNQADRQGQTAQLDRVTGEPIGLPPLSEEIAAEYGKAGDHAPVTTQTFSEKIIQRAEEFELVKTSLLQANDVVDIRGIGKVVKASGYNRIAMAMGLYEELVSLEETRDDAGNILRANARVKITHPATGRSIDGIGACTVAARMKDPNHEVPAIAHTRARKRALDVLIGGVDTEADFDYHYGEQSEQGRPVQQQQRTVTAQTRDEFTAEMQRRKEQGLVDQAKINEIWAWFNDPTRQDKSVQAQLAKWKQDELEKVEK